MECYLKGDKIEGEIWQSIAGFPGYEVSHLGRVRRFIRKEKGHRYYKIKTLSLNAVGNLLVGMKDENGVNTTRTVSYLVAAAFLDPGEEGQAIRYKDGNNMNCCASNLYYQPDNNPAQIIVGPAQPKRGNASITEDQAREIRQLIASGIRRQRVMALTGCTVHIYKNIQRGKSWTHV
jgi:hypothetical protein